ncbi:MAG: hypothetical protein WCF16_02020 [Alphaproteobacteria bacterium]
MSHLGRNLCALALVLVASACAHGKGEKAGAGEPAPGTALLYVLDTSGWSFIEGSDSVFDQGRKIVTLTRGRYAAIAIAPGRHAVRCGAAEGHDLVFDANPGYTYYLRTARDPSMIASSSKHVCAWMAQDEAVRVMREMDRDAKARARRSSSDLTRPNLQ